MVGLYNIRGIGKKLLESRLGRLFMSFNTELVSWFITQCIVFFLHLTVFDVTFLNKIFFFIPHFPFHLIMQLCNIT